MTTDDPQGFGAKPGDVSESGQANGAADQAPQAPAAETAGAGNGKDAGAAAELAAAEGKITQELLATQGKPVDIGGYYFPDDDKCVAAMRPSATLNAIIDRM